MENVKECPLITVMFQCPICGEEHSLMLDMETYLRVKIGKDMGMSIQDIVPEMPAEDREKFITGMCNKCQEEIFGGKNNAK